MLLKHNVASRQGATDLARAFTSAGARFVAIDQEGGVVQRLGSRMGYTDIPRARTVGQRMTPAEARELYTRVAQELKATGFNLNLAPVVDVQVDANPVIGRHGRAYAKDAETIVAYAAAFVEGHRRAGVGCTLKHFPGHGTSRGDSHDGAVDITQTWGADELEPFQRLIRSGHADAVMLGHLFHAQFSDGGEPVTLSRSAIEGLLRRRLGFDGVVVTDDLDMGAIRRRHPAVRAAVLAIQAGADMIMLSNSAAPDPDLAPRVVEAVLDAVAKGQIPERRIRDAHARIDRFSRRYDA